MKIWCDAIQLFAKNANQWYAKPLTSSDRAAFHQARQEAGVRPVSVHDSYLINLASPDKRLYEQSTDAFWEEMQRAESLGIPYLVMHPGSHRGSGERKGIYRIAQAINLLHRRGVPE
jgi:deoxyribonuclease-4